MEVTEDMVMMCSDNGDIWMQALMHAFLPLSCLIHFNHARQVFQTEPAALRHHGHHVPYRTTHMAPVDRDWF